MGVAIGLYSMDLNQFMGGLRGLVFGGVGRGARRCARGSGYGFELKGFKA